MQEIFYMIQEREDDYKYDVCVSMMEVYNEQARDLLTSNNTPRSVIDIHYDPKHGISVDNLTSVQVTKYEDVVKVFIAGNKNRSTGATNIHEHSSRSHSIFSISIIG